jgi:carbon-monoxide dehydrogenase small subunit
MRRVSLTVNGETVTVDVAPRTHLADFLREDRLLTATHLGCEHGVCGACTLLIDDAPARSCIAFVVALDGADVRTLEGLEHDPVIVRLRAAFTAEHALQCGYCTPGMLITARDIVQRLPGADEARIRLELAGNLCRCTGYAGIVHAIQRVLADGSVTAPLTARPLPVLPSSPAPAAVRAAQSPNGLGIDQTLRLAVPLAAAWSAVCDPRLVADCIPGARVLAVDGDRLCGEVRAAFGPIETLFSGEGHVSRDEAAHCAEITGEGRDQRTGTRISGRVTLHLRSLDATSCQAVVTIDHALRGPLAQIARGAIIEEFAADLARTFAGNLEARLTGVKRPTQRRLATGRLLLRAALRRLRGLLHLRRDPA